MSTIPRSDQMSNYQKYPFTFVEEHRGELAAGYDSIIARLFEEYEKSGREDYLIAVDTYPGVRDEEVTAALKTLPCRHFFDMRTVFKSEEDLAEQLKYHLTDDRVFGKMYFGELEDLMDPVRLAEMRGKVKEAEGLCMVYGFGAFLAAPPAPSALQSGGSSLRRPDLSLYLDLARWEIQLRYRSGMPNYNCTNFDEDILRKFKRGYFIEWRVADKHKMRWFDRVDYFVDTNRAGEPKMASGEAIRDSLRLLTERPFRTVPYFDPGVWGGQWMKEVCGLDKSKPNYAWSFDGVPEENSLLFDFGNGIFELPAMDLVLTRPVELLGEKVYARFGAEFPIRFDFLDTIGGQNLSLQVHPVTDYIRRSFGMAYTQDESYYILDADENASVYLGLTQDADPGEMFAELERANRGECLFDAEKYVNRFPAAKHDHFLIPAGTCHGAGSGTMVLEISATPYIFTFKLWDWGRLGLDGKPRPVHLEHGRQVVRADRKRDWVEKNLVNAVCTVNENEDYTEERTGLHELEFIETRRYTIRTQAELDTCGIFNMLNLVEGSAAVIESPDGRFEPYTVHYAETFIVPAKAGRFSIRPLQKGQTIIVIRAYVRT